MRYGIPTGYKAKLSKRLTQQYVFIFVDKLTRNVLSDFGGLLVDSPQAVAGDSGMLPQTAGRAISFDTLRSAKIHNVLTDPGIFLSKAVALYQPNFQSSLVTRGIYASRDAPISHTSGVCTQLLFVEGRVVAADAIE